MQALQTGTRLCLRSILFATDFSAYSERAFPFAFRLAQRYGATVHVAHVIAPESPSGKTMDRMLAEDSRDLREARTSLAEFLASAPAGVRYGGGLLQQGDFAQAFADMVKEQEAGLLVVGTHGRQGLEKLLLGSVAEQVLGAAPCPVMVVGPGVRGREPGAGEVEQIIYATDFSPAAWRALPFATALSHDFDARLVLVNVVGAVEGMALHDAGAHKLAQQDRVRESERALMKMRMNLETLPHEPEIVVIAGDPGEVIPEIAARLSAGLIVMGAHARRLAALSTHLPCGTAHHVISRAECPVLLVPK